MRDRLRANAVCAIQLPIGSETNFRVLCRPSGCVLTSTTMIKGTDIEETDVPANAGDRRKNIGARLVEAVAETDEAVIEKYLDGVEL